MLEFTSYFLSDLEVGSGSPNKSTCLVSDGQEKATGIFGMVWPSTVDTDRLCLCFMV